MIAATPEPPYTAVIFSSLMADDDGYAVVATEMESLAAQQPGWLGFETARTPGGLGISVSYWRDAEAARSWKRVAAHLSAQRLGADRFYAAYRVRIATVDREYGSDASGSTVTGPRPV